MAVVYVDIPCDDNNYFFFDNQTDELQYDLQVL